MLPYLFRDSMCKSFLPILSWRCGEDNLSSYAAVGADGLPATSTTWPHANRSVDRVLVSTSVRRWFLRLSSTCFTHVFFGAWRRTFHVGGRWHQSSLYGSREMSIRHRCPNHCKRLFCVASSIMGWLPHCWRTVSFQSRSSRDTSKICLRHYI